MLPTYGQESEHDTFTILLSGDLIACVGVSDRQLLSPAISDLLNRELHLLSNAQKKVKAIRAVTVIAGSILTVASMAVYSSSVVGN